jgi:RimJ/RimL family protein N-acetyltransferase
MQATYTTHRLLLQELTLSDTEFIRELVNTPEWIRFIGNRNIKTEEDAARYIQKIIDNPNISYWVVKLKEKETPAGVITFIKRDYLDHYDIGFAFLSRYTRKGYVYEAAMAVLNDAIKNDGHTRILATTIRENENSIELLEKLGLRFYKEITIENELLSVYSVSTDR